MGRPFGCGVDPGARYVMTSYKNLYDNWSKKIPAERLFSDQHSPIQQFMLEHLYHGKKYAEINQIGLVTLALDLVDIYKQNAPGPDLKDYTYYNELKQAERNNHNGLSDICHALDSIAEHIAKVPPNNMITRFLNQFVKHSKTKVAILDFTAAARRDEYCSPLIDECESTTLVLVNKYLRLGGTNAGSSPLWDAEGGTSGRERAAGVNAARVKGEGLPRSDERARRPGEGQMGRK
jgi:hypothetical protein